MAMNELAVTRTFAEIIKQTINVYKIKKEYELATEKVRSETRITLTQLRLEHKMKMRAIEANIAAFDKVLKNSDSVFYHKLIEQCYSDFVNVYKDFLKNPTQDKLELANNLMNILNGLRSDLRQKSGSLMNEFSKFLALPDSRSSKSPKYLD